MENLSQEQLIALIKSNPELAAALYMQLKAAHKNASQRLAALEYQKYALDKHVKQLLKK